MEFSVELTLKILFDDALLDEVASQGVRYISVPYDLIESNPKKIIRERAAALASRGISVDNAHPRFGSYNTAYSLVNQYENQRKLYLEQLKDGLDRMSILNVRTAPLHTGGACQPDAPEWALEMCAESVREILPEAENAGIVLTMENTFFNKPNRWDGVSELKSDESSNYPMQITEYRYDDIDKLCKLIEMISSPYVKGCFDAGHAHFLGDLRVDHAKMADNITLYHLHDNNRRIDMHLPPGYGTLNWEVLGEQIKSVNHKYPIFIEADPWTKGKYGQLIRETRALLSGGRIHKDKSGQKLSVRCLNCGHLVLFDDSGEFCGCR